MIKNGNMSNINIQFSKMITNTMDKMIDRMMSPIPINLYVNGVVSTSLYIITDNAMPESAQTPNCIKINSPNTFAKLISTPNRLSEKKK